MQHQQQHGAPSSGHVDLVPYGSSPHAPSRPGHFAFHHQQRATPPSFDPAFDPTRRFSHCSDSASCASVVSDDGSFEEGIGPGHGNGHGHLDFAEPFDDGTPLPSHLILGCGGTVAEPLAYEEEVSTTHADGTVTTVLKPKRGQGYSCHHCKTTKEPEALFFCSSPMRPKKGKSATCKKKYCASCLTRLYPAEFSAGGRYWRCPACKSSCVCASCERKITGRAAPKKKRLTPRAGPTAATDGSMQTMMLDGNQDASMEGSSSVATDGSIQSGLPSVAAAAAAVSRRGSRGRIAGSRLARTARSRANSGVDYAPLPPQSQQNGNGPALAQPVACSVLAHRAFAPSDEYSPISAAYYAESSSASASPRRSYHRTISGSRSAQVSREPTPSHETMAMEGIVLTSGQPPMHHGAGPSGYSPLHSGVRRFSASGVGVGSVASSAAPSHSASPFHMSSHAHSHSTSSAVSDQSDLGAATEGGSLPQQAISAIAATTLAHARSSSPIVAVVTTTVPTSARFAQPPQQQGQQQQASVDNLGQFASERHQLHQAQAQQAQHDQLHQHLQHQPPLQHHQSLDALSVNHHPASSHLVDPSPLLRVDVGGVELGPGSGFPATQSDLVGLSLDELQAMSERLELAMAQLRSEEARTAREEAEAVHQPMAESLAHGGVSQNQLLEFEARLLRHQRQLSEEQASLQQQQQQQQDLLASGLTPQSQQANSSVSLETVQLFGDVQLPPMLPPIHPPETPLPGDSEPGANVPCSSAAVPSPSGLLPPSACPPMPAPVAISLAAAASTSSPVPILPPMLGQLDAPGSGLALPPLPQPDSGSMKDQGLMSPLDAPLMSPAMLDEILSPLGGFGSMAANRTLGKPPPHQQHLQISLTPVPSSLTAQWGLTRLSSLVTPMSQACGMSVTSTGGQPFATPSPWDHLTAQHQQPLQLPLSTVQPSPSDMRLSPN